MRLTTRGWIVLLATPLLIGLLPFAVIADWR